MADMQDLKKYPKVFLHTGDCYLAVKPTLVTTVLGSCVAVTLCEPRRKVGVICHAFLPDSSKHTGERDPQACRYVDTALENMLSGMTKLGIPLNALEVKIFGGAGGIGGTSTHQSTYSVGQRNVMMAKAILEAHGLRVANMNVGGNFGRKLHFLSHSGDVWLKRLKKLSSAAAPVKKEPVKERAVTDRTRNLFKKERKVLSGQTRAPFRKDKPEPRRPFTVGDKAAAGGSAGAVRGPFRARKPA
ncbi:MAG: chemotaxis protein CheD [Desulfovibrio sp.]